MVLNADRYFAAGLLGDLSIGCGDWTEHQEIGIELDNWLGFIRKVINKYGTQLASLQITNEPNLSFMEGSKPYIMQALVEGVIAAKKEAQEQSLPIKIGFGSVPESPASVLHFWEKDLATVGIPTTVPIRVTENGWSTGKNPLVNIARSYEHQTEVLETVIRTIYNLRLELNISHYEFFGLRDADSSKEDIFHQYGIMSDDYSPKPAYYTFKKLIHELGM